MAAWRTIASPTMSDIASRCRYVISRTEGWLSMHQVDRPRGQLALRSYRPRRRAALLGPALGRAPVPRGVLLLGACCARAA